MTKEADKAPEAEASKAATKVRDSGSFVLRFLSLAVVGLAIASAWFFQQGEEFDDVALRVLRDTGLLSRMPSSVLDSIGFLPDKYESDMVDLEVRHLVSELKCNDSDYSAATLFDGKLFPVTEPMDAPQPMTDDRVFFMLNGANDGVARLLPTAEATSGDGRAAGSGVRSTSYCFSSSKNPLAPCGVPDALASFCCGSGEKTTGLSSASVSMLQSSAEPAPCSSSSVSFSSFSSSVAAAVGWSSASAASKRGKGSLPLVGASNGLRASSPPGASAMLCSGLRACLPGRRLVTVVRSRAGCRHQACQCGAFQNAHASAARAPSQVTAPSSPRCTCRQNNKEKK
ncbi:hypothetical protein ON010_g15481 [Phytophthora cinnamomi]|nr:hypothetical protein ON010_g15481 [Phytophthora cinnamomi]